MISGDKRSLFKRTEPAKIKIDIPMPFFDSKTHPSAIAVPFRRFSLRNVESKSSAYILLKFYVAATKCLASKDADQSSVNTFNSDFYAFLNWKVIPHMCDEKFYSAFGGILRVVETLKQLGVSPSSESEYNSAVRLHEKGESMEEKENINLGESDVAGESAAAAAGGKSESAAETKPSENSGKVICRSNCPKV